MNLPSLPGLQKIKDLIIPPKPGNILTPEAQARAKLPNLPGIESKVQGPPKPPVLGPQVPKEPLVPFQTPSVAQKSSPVADAPAFGFVDPDVQARHLFQTAYVKPKDDSLTSKADAVFKTIYNLPIAAIQEFVSSPILRVATSAAEAITQKPEGLKVDFKSPLAGDKTTSIQGAQSTYNDQIKSGVPHKDAFLNSAIQLGLDLAILVPMAHGVTKAGLVKFSPESLLEKIKISRQVVGDILADRPVPKDVLEAFKSLDQQQKAWAAKGLLEKMPTPEPSLLGKVFGLNKEQAKILFDQAMLLRAPAPEGTLQLPGYRPKPGTEPAFNVGMRIQETERIGGMPDLPGLSKKVVPKSTGLDALTTETKKYKSAEEFESAVLGGKIPETKLKDMGFEVVSGGRIRSPNGDELADVWNKANLAEEVKRVSDNLLKHNPGLTKSDAEAMARDIIKGREFSSGKKLGLTIDERLKPLADKDGMVTMYRAAPDFPTDKFTKDTHFATDPKNARYYAESHYTGDPSDITVREIQVPASQLKRGGSADSWQLKEDYLIENKANSDTKPEISISPVKEANQPKASVSQVNKDLAAELSDVLEQSFDSTKDLNFMDKAHDERISNIVKSVEDIRRPASKQETVKNIPGPGKPRSKMITKAEDVLLRNRVRDEARGAKVGVAYGKRITREELIQKFRESQETLATIRREVASYIQEILPADAQGKFLQNLSGEINKRKAYKIFDRANTLKESIDRKEIIAEIKDLRLPKKGSPNIAVDYQKKMVGILAGLDFSKPTEATLKSLRSLQDYLRINSEALNLHPDLLTRLDRLSKKPLASMSKQDLLDLKDTLEHLDKLGRLKAALKNKYDARVRQQNLQKLLSSTQDRGKIADKDSSMVERRVMDVKDAYVSTLHTPRVADYIDGFQGYQGENAKLIKRVGAAETNAVQNTTGIMAEALEQIKALGLESVPEEMQKRISIHLAKDQLGRAEVVEETMKAWGMKEIPVLTEQEQAVVKIVRDAFKPFENDLAAVHEEIEGIPFQKVDNYFPQKYEGERNLIPAETKNPDPRRTTKTEQGFTKSRVAGVRRVLRSDFLAVMEEAIGDQQWYINLQPELENIKYLTMNRDYLGKGGERAFSFWKNYMDVVARHGWESGAKNNRFLRDARMNLNTAILGYKASTVLLQPFAIFDAMALAQTRYGGRATLEILKEFTKSWALPGYSKKIISESPALQQRAGGEVAIADALEQRGTGLYSKVKQGSMSLIRKADVKTAAGVQQGIENILKTSGIPNAKQEAEFMMNLAQGSSNVAYRPLVLAKGEGARTMFTFQTFILNRWGIIVNDLIRGGVFQEGWMQKLNGLIGLGILVAGAIAENEARKEITGLISGKKPEDRSMTSQAIAAIPEQIPFFGNIIESLLSGYDADIEAPVMGVVEDIFNGTKAGVTGKKTNTKIRGGILALRGFLALFTGLPGTYQGAEILKRQFPDKKKGALSPSLKSLKGGSSGLPGLGGRSLPKLPGL